MLKKSPQTPTLFPSISGKKIKTENNISDYLWTVLIIEDNQQSEVVDRDNLCKKSCNPRR